MVDEAGRKAHFTPSPELQQLNVARNRPARRSGSWVGKRNTQGFYWFEQTARHIWWDSMTEYTALMLHDHRELVADICSQPLLINFADGSSHYPDVFVRYADGRQELCNVRPLELIDDETAATFRATEEICEAVGWTHRVLDDLTFVQRQNLEWLAGFRHPRNRASKPAAEQLLAVAQNAVAFGELWEVTQRSSDPYALAGLHNLMWQRALVFDTHSPLQFDTIIWSA
ncbi:TnsA-like heteromeric transposase endonuclease subunit [Curtobacterium flaccumfaciens pv. flaccumfaciens]|uniref:TnsA-like heteromeric transposase endonuclease subunit n=1 Tax=Curtobacterium flaccumfaciens TaxID=2035 RepID=UPI001BD07C60|nr:TnsA-like heteromeric transposase endonuclease subunit [Curtobacterium flaccumfaciens]QVG65541.1 TnsA-like heteromeric transposase endonuclease subunit [Curtobacterium flaccumfaciens pv. flaccumfaciens]